MLANSPKDNQISSAETGALYYFPEIPCSADKDRSSASTPNHFIGGALDRNDDHSIADEDLQDSEQVCGLIEEAFNKGLAQGREEVIAAQQERVEQVLDALRFAAEEMVRVRRQDLDRMESETVRLALTIAKKIIGHDTEHGQLIGEVVKAAMKKVADPRQLTLKLNPMDLDAVNAIRQQLVAGDDLGSVLDLEADDGIQRGGCIIETQLGDVDARIDQQIKIVEELLNDQLPKPVAES